MSTQKLFFSYSRSDSIFALKLAKDLREAGADIWIDQLDIPAGAHWDSAVEKALNSAAYVLVILSPASTASTNVMDEVSFALESGKKIIPVLLDDCLAPFRLRRLQRLDFTSDYNAGFSQLVQALDLNVAGIPKSTSTSTESTQAPVASPEKTEAKAKENEKREHQLWDDACRINTIEAYQRYLQESRIGEHKAEAKLLIKQLEVEQKEAELEVLLWEKAKEENSVNLYQHYLQEYPQGNYKTFALAAIADLERAEKEELKRIKELEKQAEKEKAAREKEEKEKAAREKAEKDKEIQLQREKEKQIQKEKEQRERQEREKEEQLAKEKALLEKQQRDKEKQLQKEKELREKQERDKARQLQKEKEQLEKQQAKEKALKERLERGEPVPSGNNKKYAMIGGGVLILLLVIFGLTKMGGGNDDKQAWKEALSKNDSTAFATYQAKFPEGKYFVQAKEKIDSLYWVDKAIQDSLQALAAAQKSTTTPKTTPTTEDPKKNEPAKNEPAKNEPAKKEPAPAKPKTTTTTTTPSKTPAKLTLGQSYGGGTIIYLNAKGDHGMIVSDKEVGNVDWEKAQKICAAYKVGNFAGWRLPSKDELNIIYNNRKFIGNYTKGSYWSATEEGKNSAWFQNFVNGNQGKGNKQSNNAVRAVRPF